MSNLVANGIRHTPSGGEVAVTVREADGLDAKQFAAWIVQAAAMPGWGGDAQ